MGLHGIRGARTEWHVKSCLLFPNTASEHHQEYSFSSEIVVLRTQGLHFMMMQDQVGGPCANVLGDTGPGQPYHNIRSRACCKDATQPYSIGRVDHLAFPFFF